MSRNISDFRQHVERYIKDRWLSQSEWNSAIENAGESGLTPEEGERCLIRLCQEKGAKIERFVVRELETLVEVGAASGVLAAPTRAWIVKQGFGLLAGVSLRHTTAEAFIDRVITQTLRAMSALDEAEIHQRLDQKVAPQVGKRTPLESWCQVFKEFQPQSLAPKVSRQSLVTVFHRWLRVRDLEIEEPRPVSGTNPPPPEKTEPFIDPGSVSPPPVEGTKHQVKTPIYPKEPAPVNPMIALLKMAGLSLLIAALVFGALRLFLDPPAELAEPAGRELPVQGGSPR